MHCVHQFWVDPRALLASTTCSFFFFFRLNKFKECNVSSQATAWFKK